MAHTTARLTFYFVVAFVCVGLLLTTMASWQRVPRLSPCSVAFLVPSLGRPNLTQAVQSVLHQRRSDWRVLIVWDTYTNTAPYPPDERIHSTSIKMAPDTIRSLASMVRNYGLRTTPWQ